MIVQVLTDVGKKKPIIMNAKVIDKSDTTFKIQYLSPTSELFNGKRLYKYETDVYEIEEDSITDTVIDERCIGFKKIDEDGFIKTDSDNDYCPSESESDYDSESVTESGSEENESEDGYQDEYGDDYGDDDYGED